MSRKNLLFGTVLIAMLAVAGWYATRIMQQSEAGRIQYAGDGAPTLPAFSFADLEGVTRHSSEWDGKVLVVNFWATWCPPCREEMPLFTKLQKQYADKGLQFVGIAIDDPVLVQDFVDIYEINFPIMIGSTAAIELSTTMGNRFQSLPFTAIYDREGHMRHIQAGLMTKEILDKQLIPLL